MENVGWTSDKLKKVGGGQRQLATPHLHHPVSLVRRPPLAVRYTRRHFGHVSRLSMILVVQDLRTQQKVWQRPPKPGEHWTVRPGVVVMKFGEQLEASKIHEYEWYYIDYNALKGDLKSASGPAVEDASGGKGKQKAKRPRREWTEDDEHRFVTKLEAELEKVHQKQMVKTDEIQRRIEGSDKLVKDVVDRLRERGTGDGPSEEEFMLLEEDVSNIIADVHDLAKFVQLNYTGFSKIIKKHDVRWRPRVVPRAFTDEMPHRK